LVFENISPYVDAKSLRVPAGDKVRLLSVNYIRDSLSEENKPEVLKKLEKRSFVIFIRKPRSPRRNTRLLPYLLNCGKHFPSYEIHRRNLINEVTGKVYDMKTEEHLPGVSVLVKGTSIGITTDFDGKFRIMIPDDSNTLVFSYLGYYETR
jgi:hypothetical protein